MDLLESQPNFSQEQPSVCEDPHTSKCKGLKPIYCDRARPVRLSPTFWDTFSHIRLTRGALREFQYRTRRERQQRRQQQRKQLPQSSVLTTSISLPKPTPVQAQRFARRGGPDLTHLRGFAAFKMRGSSQHSRGRPSAITGGTRARKINPSDSEYRGMIVEAGLYPQGYPYPDENPDPPRNIDGIRVRMAQTRPSLSHSHFTEADFEKFQREADEATGEVQTMGVIKTMMGSRANYYSMGNQPFNNIDNFREDIADAQPDLYDGAHFMKMDPSVRHKLGKTVFPCIDTSRPAAPNFFIEAKSETGPANVAKLQVCHDGAIGARGQHALQNFGIEKPVYDDHARTLSATYHNGTQTLQTYAHHVTAPREAGGQPEYHMTRLNAFAMTGNIEHFREGAGALRNLRDLAAENRDSSIEKANDAARQQATNGRSNT